VAGDVGSGATLAPVGWLGHGVGSEAVRHRGQRPAAAVSGGGGGTWWRQSRTSAQGATGGGGGLRSQAGVTQSQAEGIATRAAMEKAALGQKEKCRAREGIGAGTNF
jgi:hypothetical protein